MPLDKPLQNISKKIAFVLFDYPIGVSSMVINSAELFAQRGFLVDVFTNKKNFNRSPVSFSKENIRVHIYDDPSSILFKVHRFIIHSTKNLLLLISRTISNRLNLLLLFPHAFMFSRWLKKMMKNEDYSSVIPVEFFSLVVLEFLKDREKIVYFNMELLDWVKNSEVVENQLLWKTFEFREIKKLHHVAAPSKSRAKTFSEINSFDYERISILPVASMGEPVKEKSQYFRDKFDIPDEKIIVLYSGNLKSWAQCMEIVRSVKKWPPQFVLVMHTWNKKIMKTGYVRDMIRQSEGLPVHFSYEYIDYDKLPQALSSADIGLAFYENIDRNFSEILYSSNKIGEYLKAGLAVICTDFPELKDFVDENQIGRAIPLDILPGTLENILPVLGNYRRNATECYQNKYRFEIYFENFLKNISLTDKPGSVNYGL